MKKKIAIATFALGIIFGVFLAPASSVFAQTPATNNPYSTEFEAQLQTCTTENWTITGCLLEAYYNVILYPSSWLAYMTGSIFDYFIAYSLDTASYNGVTSNEFVNKGWAIMRDIANVLFIFALLYVAIKHILQAAGSETKKFLKSIIIAALLINFSLFFTKVIIDAGNILARAFYNNIEVTNDDGADHKTISQALVEKVSPQKILSTNLFKPRYGPGLPPGTLDPGWTFLIMLVVTIVNVVIALTFLSTFLLFAARVIGLWFMMIFSPLAFASIAIPGASNFFGDFGWGKWLKQTLSLSFMAPVFLFFLFLLIMFLDIAFSSTVPTGDQSSIQQLMFVFIPFIAIVLILGQAKNIAKKMAGEFGEQTTKWAGKAVGMVAGATLGLAGGAVIGGAAKLGRASIGAGANKLSHSRFVKKWAPKSGTVRRIQMASEGLSKSSFDFRNTQAASGASKLLGQGLGAAGFAGNVNFGKGTTKGGYVQRLEEYQKKKEAYAEKLKSSDEDKQVTTYVDTAGVAQPVNKSMQEAETDFLRAQNEAKRRDESHTIRNVETGGNDNLTLDHDGWTKEKEKAEKRQNQAQTDLQIAQTEHAAGRISDTDLAQVQQKLTRAKERNTGIKQIIDNIESGWKNEERAMKAVQKKKNQHDTTVLRQYAESVKPGTINTIYEIVKGQPTMAREARRGASGSVALAAEKSEKKAQAEEKKADKAH